MIEREWLNLPERFPLLKLDEFMVMPDHFHGILCLLSSESHVMNDTKPGEHKVRPYGTASGSVGRITQAFKSRTTVQYGKGVKKFGWLQYNEKLWQRGYYEHVLRNHHDLESAREYINFNPRAYNHSTSSE